MKEDTISDVIEDPSSEEIKEEVQKIKVSQNNFKEAFKEISFVVNTLQSGKVECTTPSIRGKIECVIINRLNTDTIIKPLSIKACMVEEDVQIINMVSENCSAYLPIRTETVFKSDEEVSEYNVAYYYINGPIYFEINGALNSEVQIRVRYK